MVVPTPPLKTPAPGGGGDRRAQPWCGAPGRAHDGAETLKDRIGPVDTNRRELAAHGSWGGEACQPANRRVRGDPPPRGPVTGRLPAEAGPRPRGGRLSPYVLGYAMGPAALVTLLFLRHFGVVANVPVWLWLAVFAAIPPRAPSLEVLCRRNPSTVWLNARVACHVAAVTAVIYLTGWGRCSSPPTPSWRSRTSPTTDRARGGAPRCGAFSASPSGSSPSGRDGRRRSCRSARARPWASWAPSCSSSSSAWPAPPSSRKKRPRPPCGSSEERFRSLVQNSTDTTFVMGPEGRILYASPATVSLFGRSPEDVLGMRASELVHPEDRPRVEAQLAALVDVVTVTEPIQFRVEHARRHLPLRRGRRVQPARQPLGGAATSEPPRHHRAQRSRDRSCSTWHCTTR